jgi:CelD/BcsL family acetyltransferase involved in cellulose biosynthesis
MPAAASAIALDVIADSARLAAFEPEWQRFLQGFPPPTPFQTPEWLLTWWSHFGSGEPHVLVFRHERGIAGVMPCFLHAWNGRTQLTIMGTGISDCLDPVFDPEHVFGILDTLACHLSRNSDWDICDWQDLSADTPLQALAAARPDTPCSEIELNAPFDAFLQCRPAELKRNLRQCKNRSRAFGDLEFEAAAHSDPGLLATAMDLHGARWREAGQSGTIAANGSADFLREVCPKLSTQDMLRFFVLRLAGSVVAILLALRTPSTLFSYMPAFDPAYKKYGFGNVLHEQALRYAHENGYRSWSFLRGEEPYKFKWGAQPIGRSRLVVCRPR